ncbi:MAG: Mor transcription activator family protein [Syntrophorhabdaceae bacterium]|nr:Mor transcription activator family protein [Syntrophorhabdaceae bacterium]
MLELKQTIPGVIRDNILVEDLHPTIRMIADIVGIDGAIKISAECGGTNIYIPKLEISLAKARARAIVKAFNGSNYLDLARKFKVSDRYVRSVVERARKGH